MDNLIILKGGENVTDTEREKMKQYLDAKKKKQDKRKLETSKDHLWHNHDSLEHKKKGRPISK